ncbi:MAG: serine hydrolase [Gemmatimonadetes bacterium]|nr:serine hydrolase [Gemmatimonadota bacterium]
MLLASVAACAPLTAQYVPPAGAWEQRAPEQVGVDASAVEAAVAFAIENESTGLRDLLANHYRTFGREPHGEAVGPFMDRGDPTGIIVRNGYIIAEWGDPHRVDVTFSVTKSFLSTTVGLALDDGLIDNLGDPVHAYMAPVLTYPAHEVIRPFDSVQNRRVTWDHLLRQTSDFEGTLWGKPDWADRPRGDPEEWRVRPRNEPGTVYSYNDVRVNALALAALNVWRRPLPQVLRERVMDPIGASDTWRWYGYDSSWIVLDGVLMQSVSGGAHWGGGMFISARDMARFGLLTLRRGRWGDRQILSDHWITLATTPTAVQPTYGFMNYFLNTDRRPMPSAPAQAFYHLGAGNNVVYVDPVNDLVIVMRWISSLRAADGVVQRVLDGIRR